MRQVFISLALALFAIMPINLGHTAELDGIGVFAGSDGASVYVLAAPEPVAALLGGQIAVREPGGGLAQVAAEHRMISSASFQPRAQVVGVEKDGRFRVDRSMA